jgi:hypothetical protein
VGGVIATLQLCGKVEVKVVVEVVSKEHVDMIMITVWLLNFGDKDIFFPKPFEFVGWLRSA